MRDQPVGVHFQGVTPFNAKPAGNRRVIGTGGLGCPFDRVVVVYTFLAVLLYLSAAVIWPVFCFDPKYGEPGRPPDCPRGSCPWDSQLVVATFTYVNLLLYIADLAYSQRIRFVPTF